MPASTTCSRRSRRVRATALLCNTSLNFSGKGFINNLRDLDAYTVEHQLDGFVVEGRAYLCRNSKRYRAYLGPAAICCARCIAPSQGAGLASPRKRGP